MDQNGGTVNDADTPHAKTETAIDQKPSDGYVPFGLDFEQLVQQVTGNLAGMPDTEQERVASAVRHIRDELSDLTDRQIARVLLTGAIICLQLVAQDPQEKFWNGQAIANYLAACGEHLWTAVAGQERPASEPADGGRPLLHDPDHAFQPGTDAP